MDVKRHILICFFIFIWVGKGVRQLIIRNDHTKYYAKYFIYHFLDGMKLYVEMIKFSNFFFSKDKIL